MICSHFQTNGLFDLAGHSKAAVVSSWQRTQRFQFVMQGFLGLGTEVSISVYFFAIMPLKWELKNREVITLACKLKTIDFTYHVVYLTTNTHNFP